MLGANAGCDKEGPKRLPESGFQVGFAPQSVPSEIVSGETGFADITVKNMSPVGFVPGFVESRIFGIHA